MGLQGGARESIATYLLFMATGLLLLGLAWVNDLTGSRVRRMWGRWLYRLVPIYCVLPLHFIERPLRRLDTQWLVVWQIGAPAAQSAPPADASADLADARETGAEYGGEDRSGDRSGLFDWYPEAVRRDVYLTELAVFAACWLFVGLAVLLQWRWYLFYGLVHSAAQFVLFTDKHLSDRLSWPVALLIAGSLVMLAGMAIELRFGRESARRKRGQAEPDAV